MCVYVLRVYVCVTCARIRYFNVRLLPIRHLFFVVVLVSVDISPSHFGCGTQSIHDETQNCIVVFTTTTYRIQYYVHESNNPKSKKCEHPL